MKDYSCEYNRMGMQGLLCAAQAGGCAALATVCGKLALTPSSIFQIGETLGLYVNQTLGLSLPVLITDEQVTWIARLVAVAGIFFFNALMWVLFTKSMHLCNSTLEATACTTSANFLSTAVYGKVLFREQLGTLWWIGSALVVLGLAVLHRSSSPATTKLSCTENEESPTKKVS